MAKDTKESAPPGIAKRWPTLLMIKLGRITMHRFTEALEPFGIRPRHVAALIELRDRGELTQQSLCGQLHLDPTNLVAILNELEQRGYVKRRRDPEDRRRHLVEVSKKGIAVIDKVSEVMDGVEDDLLEGFEPAEREQLEGLLNSIWERSGGYEAWSQVAAEADDRAAEGPTGVAIAVPAPSAQRARSAGTRAAPSSSTPPPQARAMMRRPATRP